MMSSLQMGEISLNWADLIILVIILISAVIGFVRGFFKEALSLVTWVAAFVIARLFSDNLAYLLTDYIDTPSLRLGIAFAILFIATLIVGALINNLIGQMVKLTGLSGTDHVLGIFFGIARGLLLVVVCAALIRLTPAVNDKWWRDSYLIPHFQLIEAWSRDSLSEISDKVLNAGEDNKSSEQDSKPE